MEIKARDLGYREVFRLAEFMQRIADKGIPDDVANKFSYCLAADEPYVITESGKIIFGCDIEEE